MHTSETNKQGGCPIAVRRVSDVHFVRPAPMPSPLGVGAQHVAPLLGLSMNLDVRIPRSEILDDSATRYGF